MTAIREEGQDPDDAHDLSSGERAKIGMNGRCARDPQTKHEKAGTLYERGAGTLRQHHSGDTQADGVVCGVAQEVESVGL